MVLKLSEQECLERVPDKKYLETQDIQEIFGVHEITVYKWTSAGKLKASRDKKKWRSNSYKRSDVISFIRQRFAARGGRRKPRQRTSNDKGAEKKKPLKRLKKPIRRIKKAS